MNILYLQDLIRLRGRSKLFGKYRLHCFRLWISSKFLAKTRKLMSSINEDTSYGGNLDSHAAHIPYIKLSMKHFPIISKLYAAALQIVNYKKHIYKMNIPSGLNH